MTDGISTSPHCLYKSNIVDDVIINKTRQNELVKVFCEYKTEFLILFDDFFRSQDFPKPSPVLHHFFQYTHLRDAHFGNDSNLLIVFYVQIMPDDFVMQLHR
ncbi:hypothetical protein ABN295_19645, partial [Escherichia coli]